MRVSRLEQQGADASELREWPQFLERIDDGTKPTVVMGGVQDFLRLPDAICLPIESRTEGGLVDSIFGKGRWDDGAWMTERAIRAARDEEVGCVNDAVSARFQATSPDIELLGADNEGREGNQSAAYPVEFLNSLKPSRLPSHKLRLERACLSCCCAI